MLDTVEGVLQTPNCIIDFGRQLILPFDSDDKSISDMDFDPDNPADELRIFRFTKRTPSGLHDPAQCPQRN